MDTQEKKTSDTTAGPELEQLVQRLQDRDGVVRERAREQIVSMGQAATESLLPLLGHKKEQDRWEAVKALSEIGDPATTERMITLLRDDDSDVAWLAALALINIGPSSVVPMLERVIDQRESVRIRRGAHHVLKELANGLDAEEAEPLLRLLNDNVEHDEVPVLADELRRRLVARGG